MYVFFIITNICIFIITSLCIFIITYVPVWPWEVLELLPPPGHNHGNIESKNKRKWYVACELFT